MRLIFDKILWGTLIVLFGPTVMIVASWSALPGDNLYGVKLALEKAALALASPSYATSGNLQIKYTERRFAEAKQLMASKQSIQGLPYLDQQIAETKRMIDAAPNKEAQVALAKQYITTLSTVSTDLETQKQTITTSPQPLASVPSQSNDVSSLPPPVALPQEAATPTPTPTLKSTATPTAQQSRTTSTPGVPTPSPTPTPTPTQIAQVTTTAPIRTQQAVAALQINQTQQNITKTIDDLESLVEASVVDPERNRKQKEQMEEKKDEWNKCIEQRKEEKNTRKKNKECMDIIGIDDPIRAQEQ